MSTMFRFKQMHVNNKKKSKECVKMNDSVFHHAKHGGGKTNGNPKVYPIRATTREATFGLNFAPNWRVAPFYGD